MNQRSTKIVQLLSKEKDEITVSGFAEYFQVSQKTIRNDMKEINEILDKNKRGTIDIKSGGLVSIPADFKDSLSLLLEGNFYNYKLSKEERKKVASAIIVNSADYITLAAIADRLMVSRATVINDLKEIVVELIEKAQTTKEIKNPSSPQIIYNVLEHICFGCGIQWCLHQIEDVRLEFIQSLKAILIV